METKINLKDLVHWENWYQQSPHIYQHFRNATALYSFLKKHRTELMERGAIRKTPRGVMVNQLNIENAILEVI